MKIALAGDTMLGRGVADEIAVNGVEALVAPELAAITREADLFVLNLECCVSSRGSRWQEEGKPFFFRAPPAAVELLRLLGADCVTLGNNHALDFGREALTDTLSHLEAAGVAWAGAGRELADARLPAVVDVQGLRVAIFGFGDHPPGYAARPDAPGIAYVEAGGAPVPDWLADALRSVEADVVIVSPHWGPNMQAEPLPFVQRRAAALREAGATLVAGHSAHVFHGVQRGILYDLGDFLDDYAVDPVLRNDLGLLFLVTLDSGDPVRLEAVPLELEYCHTRLAAGDEARWVRRRFRAACEALGTPARDDGDRVIVEWPPAG